jgi:hypothetical protein
MSGWNMVHKEVTDIEVNERMIYLLECMCGNDLVEKILEQKNCDNYCLAEKLMNEKYDF